MREMNVETLPKAERILYLALVHGPVDDVKYFTGKEAFDINREYFERNPGELDEPVERTDYRPGWYLDTRAPYYDAPIEYLDSLRIAAIRKAAALWGFSPDDPDTLELADRG